MPYNLSPAEKDQIRAHLRKDPVLRPLVDQLDFPEERVQLSEVYPSLLRSIVGQQVSIQAAAAIYKRFLALFDLSPDNLTVSPSPQVLAQADKEELRSAGLSYSKAQYLKNIADFWLAHPDMNDKVHHMSDDEVISELTTIKGVGQWTVEMMLMFALGRKDLLPLDDLAIYQTIQELYQLSVDKPKRKLKIEMTVIAEQWRPYRSAACLYLYAWRHHSKGKASSTR